MKTNAMRLLDRAKIPYRVVTFEVDAPHITGETVAARIGMDITSVFKTLVTQDGQDIIICLVPVAAHIDFKKLAIASGHKSIQMLPLHDLTKVTGYIRGGCSPLGMKKQFPTFMDVSALDHSEIAVSAGIRGTQIVLNPQSLIDFISITVGEFTKKEN